MDAEAFKLLPDPQTNGGLLIAVAPAAKDEVIALLEQKGLSDFIVPIGQMIGKEEKVVFIKP